MRRLNARDDEHSRHPTPKQEAGGLRQAQWFNFPAEEVFMPLVQVSVIGEKSPQEKTAIMNAVHAALVEAFGIPEHDRNIRLRSYAPGEWMLPPGKTERYVLVEIAAFAGRTPETKGKLFSQVVANLGALGIEPGDVFVIVVDQPLHNWGIRGGQRADLVDLGYSVKV